MIFLKADTAVTLKIGPFIDETDGKTAETGLTIAQADVRISKNGADIIQKNEGTACTHDELGIYGCPIDGTDTNAEGRLQLWVHESGALPVFHEYMVVNANVYDSLFAAAATDYLQVDAIQISGDATAADNCEADYDGTGYVGGTIVKQADITKIGGVAQSATDLKDFADAGYDPATNKVQGVVLADTVTAVTNTVNLSATSEGQIDAIETDTNELQGDWANGGRLDLLLDAALADTGELQTDWVNGGRLDLLIDSILGDSNELQTDWVNGGRLDLLIDTIDTIVDAIKDKTDDLPSGVAKNVALSNFEFFMVLSNDHTTAATGKTITAQISKDGGAFANCATSASEVANGVYKINLAQAEMNANVITLKFTETDCDQRTITIFTS